MKRCIAMLLILCCLLTLLPLQTQAAGTQKKLIALTLDDGPGYYTARLLDGLKERDVNVTFFVLGQCAEVYSNTLRRAYEEGHQIAQHTYSHPTLTTQSNDQIAWQLETTDSIINEILGLDREYLLRNPYGDCNSRVLGQIGRPSIVWSVDSVDWQSLNSYSVRDTIVNNAFDGAIVLAHDIHATTINGVLWAIDILKAQGYEFVTVSELFRRRGVELYDGNLYYSCKPTGLDYGSAETPVVTSEKVYGGYRVTLSTNCDADIYYSLDGSFPDQIYSGPMLVPSGTKLQTFSAYDINGDRSNLVTEEFGGAVMEAPILSTENGCIVIENPNAGTDVRYTTDETEPKGTSKCYTAPIPGYNGVLTYRVMGMGVGSQVWSVYVTENGNIFRDVAPAQWYFAPVDRAVTLGLFAGMGDYVFEPNGKLTRAMFVSVLHRLCTQGDETVEAAAPEFSDVAQTAWYYEAVAWGAENGIVAGYKDGTFCPNRTITREEMCAMLDRVLTLLEYPDSETELTFDDAEEISDWAAESVARAVELGIIVGMGDNTFAPRRTATRAEACVVLLRLYDLLVTE